MALAPLERNIGPAAYAPYERVRPGRDFDAVAPVERTVADSRPVAALEPRAVAQVDRLPDRQPVAEPVGIGGLAASARAAAVALAAVPRDVSPADSAAAAADAQDAALAALSDPFDPPSPREVAQNFAAVAALVPSPQELANDVSAAETEDAARIDASRAVRADNDEDGRALQAGVADGFAGSRLSRFA